MKKIVILLITAVMLLSGCTSAESSSASEKRIVFGDTTFNSENEEYDIDPHNAYSGWAAVRYGVGETLFRLNDEMQIEPWLAESCENTDELTWVITLRDNVSFSDGRKMDAEAVKECLEDLIDVHERAAGDLKIHSMDADRFVLTIHTSKPNPSLLNCLADPYAAIIDMHADNKNGIVTGTGPFIAEELVPDDHLILRRNEHYWNGMVNTEEVRVKTITDGDTLSLALQSGEIDMAYGMPYAAYPQFENENYNFSTVTTSRVFYVQMNYQSDIIQDDAVRKAIAMGIDKKSFVTVLLRGYGEAAEGPFPASFGFENAETEQFDLEAAQRVLKEAGWIDSDGDGIREKNGRKLQIRWLTYPSRQELPLLAETAQASLKKIGIDVQLNITPDHNSVVADPSAWDVYAGAFVTCPTGDPMYFFATHCLKDSVKNRGGYYNVHLEDLARQMNRTFGVKERKKIAAEMQQQILDDNAFIFCSFLKMSLISRKNIIGLQAHSCDYYELTAELGIDAQ